MIRRTWALLCLVVCCVLAPIPIAAQGAGSDSTEEAAPGSEPEPNPDLPQGRAGLHWRIDSAQGIGDPVAAGSLVLATQDTRLAAFDAATGETRWAWDGDGPVSRALVMGEVAFVTHGNWLAALATDTGEVRWQARLVLGHDDSLLPPVFSDTRLAPTGADGIVHAVLGPFAFGLDAETGRYLWRTEHAGTVAQAPPVVVGDHVIWSIVDDIGDWGHLAVERTTGDTAWRQFSDDGAVVQMGTPGGIAIIAHPDFSRLIGFEADSRDERWDVDCAVAFPTRIFTVGDRLVTVCYGELVAVDPDTGAVDFLFRSDGSTTLLAAQGGDAIVAVSDASGYRLAAIRVDAPADQRVTWLADLPADGGSLWSAVVTEGRIVGTTSGTERTDRALVAVGGTEGDHGAPLPFALNPPASGTFVEIIADTALRGAPSAEGVAWADLPPGAQVLITGTTEEVGDITWWQVADPGSGETGWIEPEAFDASAAE